MTGEAQCRAYAEADFSEAHDLFIALLAEKHPRLAEQGVALDLGCGNGDVSRRFLRAHPGWTLVGLDGSPEMLAWAQKQCRSAGLSGRARFVKALLRPRAAPGARPALQPGERPALPRADLLISNSLLHHLPQPAALWDALAQAADGTPIFVMDLLRPQSEAAAAALRDRYAANAPEILRRDFHNSLRAAYQLPELRAQLSAAGLPHLSLQPASDRHWIAWGEI